MADIQIKCTGELLLPWKELINIQGDLKSLSEANFEKGKRRILEKGFKAPFFVWFQTNGRKKPVNTMKILDGTQRTRFLQGLVDDGHSVPDLLPADSVFAEAEKEAKDDLLGFISQYGKVDDEKLYEYVETNDFEWDELRNTIDIPDMNMGAFTQSYYRDMDLEDVEPKIERAEELQAEYNTELGQVWELGDHRLVCGDSRETNIVDLALRRETPLLMVTDPPYGVEYDPNWRNEVLRENADRAIGKPQNDDIVDWRESYKLFPGDVMYIWHAGNMAFFVAESIIASNAVIRTQIIWAKNNIVISRGNYHPKHEPCWYAVRKGKTAHWIGDRKQSTVWNIDKPMKSETGHSTQKPIECMARPIRNHESDLVYDPFVGSGTTIIACEQLKRKCRAIEIDPGYVAVSIKRWEDLTGNKAKLL